MMLILDRHYLLPENLFGSLKSTEKINHSKIEITRLNLVLVGILSGQENPSVIISKEGAKEKIYQINDLISKYSFKRNSLV